MCISIKMRTLRSLTPKFSHLDCEVVQIHSVKFWNCKILVIRPWLIQLCKGLWVGLAVLKNVWKWAMAMLVEIRFYIKSPNKATFPVSTIIHQRRGFIGGPLTGWMFFCLQVEGITRILQYTVRAVLHGDGKGILTIAMKGSIMKEYHHSPSSR